MRSSGEHHHDFWENMAKIDNENCTRESNILFFKQHPNDQNTADREC